MASGHEAVIDWLMPGSPSRTTMHTSFTPRFLITGSDLLPVLRSLITGPDLQAQDVPLTVDGEADRAVDRAVGDQAVTDLHNHRLDEHHGLDAVQRPALPLGHLRPNQGA